MNPMKRKKILRRKLREEAAAELTTLPAVEEVQTVVETEVVTVVETEVLQIGTRLQVSEPSETVVEETISAPVKTRKKKENLTS